ncbi:MAG: acyl-CoA dehydrogenase family protein, partial [Gaiella sp.]
ESELELFAESVRGALAGFVAPIEPPLGSWWDERDDALATRLRDLGWEGLWTDGSLRGPAVAGAVELGRAVAPCCLVDEATLGGVLAVGERARHLRGAALVAHPAAGASLALVTVGREEGVDEATLDGSGTVRGLRLEGRGEPAEDAVARLHAWVAATLGYQAGLADAALAHGLAHVRSREQFGAPLGDLPTVRSALADAALACDGLLLLAWEAASDDAVPWEALAWSGRACREVTAQVLQVHGGIGFALEGGVHRFYRRAKTVQVWSDAVLQMVAARG